MKEQMKALFEMKWTIEKIKWRIKRANLWYYPMWEWEWPRVAVYPSIMAVQMGKYSEIVDVCQQKYILCAEKKKYLIPKIYCVPGNIFNSPGFIFLLQKYFYLSPKL